MCTKAPPSSFENVRELVETSLGKKLEDMFSYFSEKPIASASIAQVHEAILKETGERVAVKVQHKWLKESVHGDLLLVDIFVKVAEKLFPEFRYQWLSDETQAYLPHELDFKREGRNADRCRELLKDNFHIKVPSVYWSHTSVTPQHFFLPFKPKTIGKSAYHGVCRRFLRHRQKAH